MDGLDHMLQIPINTLSFVGVYLGLGFMGNVVKDLILDCMNDISNCLEEMGGVRMRKMKMFKGSKYNNPFCN